MEDSQKSNRLDNWIEKINFDSMTDLSLKIRPLTSGVGFLKLNSESASSNPILSLFKTLPLHAEYDLDSRHFDLGDLSPEKVLNITKNLVEKNQTLAGIFETISSPLAMESGFAQQLAVTSRRRPPLLIHFTSSLRSDDVAKFSSLRPAPLLEVVHIGPQYHCSERESIEQLISQNDKIIFLSQVQKQGLLASINNTTQADEQRPLWIRLNLNSLATGQGGNSESWATGLMLQELIESIELLSRQCFIHGISLGPSQYVEAQSLTARSAAQLLSFFVYVQSYRHVVSEFHGRKN